MLLHQQVLFKKKITKNGYGMLTIRDSNKKAYYLLSHQFAWYWENREVVICIDHINRIKTDNRISNLRSVTASQNAMNMSNVKGYSYSKREKKFIAHIMVNYKSKHLGTFDNKEDAKKCYEENKYKYHIINN